MLKFKQIKYQGVKIVQFTKKNITDEYISWLNNKNLMQFSEQSFKNHTKKTCLNYLRTFKRTSNLFLAIKDVAKNQHIGNMTVYYNKNYKTAEISLLIGPQRYQGKGFGTLAWILICKFLFKKMNVRKISGGTLSANKSMLKIFKKSGMSYEARRRKHALINGIEKDLIIYSIFKEKWLLKN
jgi:RimJ/RimL family protein N-acetyltransferase